MIATLVLYMIKLLISFLLPFAAAWYTIKNWEKIKTSRKFFFIKKPKRLATIEEMLWLIDEEIEARARNRR